MSYFLERIAGLLYDEAGENLRHHCLVFPSRRAGIYFLKYLSELIDKPVWAPAIMTVNEFFGSFSELSVADNEFLLLELYKIYRKLNPGAESFDEFYFWGDMLLSDFDDIDKYLADASLLLRNVKDLKAIDDLFGDIDPDQAEIIKQFWRNFDPQKPSPQKSDFRFLWSLLFDLYSGFSSSLREKNLAYEGMIFRDVVNKIKPWNGAFKWEKVHFIGFNALNRCEQTLMKELQDKGIARFYWDYDNSYVSENKVNSAGLYLSKNLKIFKNDMPGDWNYDTLLSSPGSKVIRKVYETTTDISQVKLLPDLLMQLPDLNTDNAHHTAVILADENLLVPVLSSLPDKIQAVNITMGYPLKMTGVYGFVRHLLNLQRNKILKYGTVFFDFQNTRNIVRHPLAIKLLAQEDFETIELILKRNLAKIPIELLAVSERLRLVFSVPSDPSQFSEYLKRILMGVSGRAEGEESVGQVMQEKLRKEFIYRVFLAVNRLDSIVQNPGVNFKTDTYMRILDKILRNQSVPFTGEPLAGIQVMGILETRALDFRNIIMLSVNEGILPAAGPGSSFIPFSIREAFGLPVINHQESIYAYHFYRLLHRAENVTFIYNSGSDGLKTGEMSRFLIQMKYGNSNIPDIRNLSFDIESPASVSKEIPRSERHQEALRAIYLDKDSSVILSPTAINMWLNCRMKFYYRYVNGLKEHLRYPVDIDYAVFGRMLHFAMKYIYDPYRGTEITDELLGSMISDRAGLQLLINTAIGKALEKEPGLPLDGNELIAEEVMGIYLIRILEADRSITPFRITDLEKSFEFSVQVNVNGKPIIVRSGGNIDRVDTLKGTARVVDYKTGDILHKINSIEDLFEDDRDKKLDCWLQTLLYCEAFLTKNNNQRVKPSVYVVKELTTDKFQDMLKIRIDKNNEEIVDNYSDYRSLFLSGLSATIETIFSSGEPFRMTNDRGKCIYCPYRKLCQR